MARAPQRHSIAGRLQRGVGTFSRGAWVWAYAHMSMRGSWLADSGVFCIGCGLAEMLEALGVSEVFNKSSVRERWRVQLSGCCHHCRARTIDKGKECQPSLLWGCAWRRWIMRLMLPLGMVNPTRKRQHLAPLLHECEKWGDHCQREDKLGKCWIRKTKVGCSEGKEQPEKREQVTTSGYKVSYLGIWFCSKPVTWKGNEGFM